MAKRTQPSVKEKPTQAAVAVLTTMAAFAERSKAASVPEAKAAAAKPRAQGKLRKGELPEELEIQYQQILTDTATQLSETENKNLETYWIIGNRVNSVLTGSFAERYGQAVLKRLAKDLKGKCPVGVSVTNLRSCARLKTLYPAGVPTWFRSVKVPWRLVVSLFRPSVDSVMRDRLLKQMENKEITPAMAAAGIKSAAEDTTQKTTPTQRSDKFLSGFSTTLRQCCVSVNNVTSHADRFARLPVDDRRPYLGAITKSLETLNSTRDSMDAAAASLKKMLELASHEPTKTMPKRGSSANEDAAPEASEDPQESSDLPGMASAMGK